MASVRDRGREQDGPVIAASYERVSTFQQARHGYSLGAQHKDATAFAAEQGWQLPDHLRFRDEDSGAEWSLPQLDRMLDAAKRGEFSVLIVPDLDRFARNMTKALVYGEQLRKYGVRVVYIRVPLEDSAEGRLLENQLHSFAEYEREKIALRTARGRREKAERGLYVGTARIPYGYRAVREPERNRIVGLEIDESRAGVIRRIFAEARDRSIDEIAAGLERDGIPGPGAGGGWSYGTTRFILHNETYSGTVRYGRHAGREPIPIAVPAIVGAQDWELAHRAIKDRKTITRRPRTPDDAFELRGCLTCALCGGALAAWPKSPTWRYYICLRRWQSEASRQNAATCPLPIVQAAAIERSAWGLVCATLMEPHWLREGLAGAQETYATGAERRAERLAVLDREAGRLAGRLQRALSDRLDVDPGSASHRALSATAEDAEAALARLGRERAELEAEPLEGLSAEDVGAVIGLAGELADEVAAGLELAAPAERHKIYTRLRLRGAVWPAEDGEQLGRSRFTIEWKAAVPLTGGGRSVLAFRFPPGITDRGRVETKRQDQGAGQE